MRAWLIVLASAALVGGCGPSQPPVYAEDVVLPAPGGAALAGIPPADLAELAVLASPVPAAPPPEGAADGAPGEAEDAEEPDEVEAAPPRLVSGQGFSYEVSGDWEELDATALGSPLLVTAQRAAAPTDGFMTNVSVAAELFDGDAADYGAANVTELAKICVVEAERPSRAGVHPALDVEAYWDNQGGVPYRTLQRYVAREGVGLVITCAAAASAFERERPVCEALVESFRTE